MDDIYLAESEQGNGSDLGTVIVRHTPDVVMIDRPPYGDNFPRPRFISRSRSPQELPASRKLKHDPTIDELDKLLAGLEQHEKKVSRNLSLMANSSRHVPAVCSGTKVDKHDVLVAGIQKLEAPGPRVSPALKRPQGNFAEKHSKDNKENKGDKDKYNKDSKVRCTPFSKGVVTNTAESLHRDLQTSVASAATSEFEAGFRHPSVQTPDFDARSPGFDTRSPYFGGSSPDFDAPTPDFDAPSNTNSTVASHRRNHRNYLKLGHGAPTNANPSHDTPVSEETLDNGRFDKPSLVLHAPVELQAQSDGLASRELAETSNDECDQSHSEVTELTTPITAPAEIPVMGRSFNQFFTFDAEINAKLGYYRHLEHLDSLPLVDTTADGLDVWGNPRPVNRKVATNMEQEKEEPVYYQSHYDDDSGEDEY
jgi:hypothetical protein